MSKKDIMFLIVGLGNPGEKYKGTRHNVGFMVLDKLIKNREIAPIDQELSFQKSEKFDAEICELRRKGEKIILIKPQAFMNNSGKTVTKIASFYNIRLPNLWIIADDIDLPLGRIRVRLKGSSAGHKGLQSIINTIGDNEFPRIRVGISEVVTRPRTVAKPGDIYDAANFVLGKFTKKGRSIINKATDQAADIIVDGIKNRTLTAHTY